ncbi:MAG: serine hydrolase domain-containing protein [Planctomycetota bacterium]
MLAVRCAVARRLRLSLTPIALLLASCPSWRSVEVDGQTFELEDFIDNLRAEVQASSVKWGFVVQRGLLVQAEAAGAKRMAPDNFLTVPFTVDDRVLILSVTKTVTSVALLQILRQQNIPVDTLIRPYFPDWPGASSLDAITFRQLLNHTSGIRGDDSDHESLQALLLDPLAVQPPGEYTYANANYGLARVLMASIAHGLSVPGMTEEEAVAQFYLSYVQENVFDEVLGGSTTIPFEPEGTLPTLYYDVNAPGQAGSDLLGPGALLDPGSNGAHMSLMELHAFWLQLWLSGDLLGDADLGDMFNSNLGLATSHPRIGAVSSSSLEPLYGQQRSQNGLDGGQIFQTIVMAFDMQGNGWIDEDDLLVTAVYNGDPARWLPAMTVRAYDATWK